MNTKKKVLLIVTIIIILGAVLFATPLAYRIGIVGPHNYKECVLAGGQTNKNQVRVVDTCTYKGKSFFGGYI